MSPRKGARLPWRNEELYALEQLIEFYPDAESGELCEKLNAAGVQRDQEGTRRKANEIRTGRIRFPHGYEQYRAERNNRERLSTVTKYVKEEPPPAPVVQPPPKPSIAFTLAAPDAPPAHTQTFSGSLIERLEEMLYNQDRGRLDSPLELPPLVLDIDPEKKITVWVTSDWHAPDHHLRRTAAFLRGLEVTKPDYLILNGDMIENTAFAKFAGSNLAKPPGLADIPVMRKLLEEVRRAAGPDCKIYYRPGNHEDRIIREHMYMTEGLPLYGWQYWLGLEDYGIEWVNYGQDIEIGDCVVTHGHYALKWAGSTGRKHLMEDGYHNVVIGHVHRLGLFSKKFRKGVTWAVEAGGLYDERKMAGYIKGKADWQPGFAVVKLFRGKARPQPILMDLDGAYAVADYWVTAEGVY